MSDPEVSTLVARRKKNREYGAENEATKAATYFSVQAAGSKDKLARRCLALKDNVIRQYYINCQI